LQTIQKNSWELLSHPPYSPDLAPLGLYHFFGLLKDHLRSHHYETDEAVRKPCEAGCEELELTSTAEAFSRFCNAGRNA
jgi:transposase